MEKYYVWDGKEGSQMILTYDYYGAKKYVDKNNTYITNANGKVIYDRRN